jgi:hypothetical protein
LGGHQEDDVPLKFKGDWRFTPPADGRYRNEQMPSGAVEACLDLIMKVATQGKRQEALEHFKGYFCEASGATHVWSSSVSWSETDLRYYAEQAAANAPLFIEAFYDACQTFAGDDPDLYAPDAAKTNALLAKYDVGYEIRPPRLVLRETEAPLVSVAERPPTLAEQAVEVFQTSLRRSETLLAEGRGREAVQESLWLLESVATAFQDVKTASGTVEGKYFNQIVKDLRKRSPGTTLDCVLEWLTALHGYLSSPTGGGVRHGLDLRKGVSIGDNEARLYCNLVRSYLSFLLSEHERMLKAK